MAKSFFRRPCVRWLALVAVFASTDGAGAPSYPSPFSDARPVVVDVIGDSLSTGVATGGEAWTSNAEQLFEGTRPAVLFVSAAENGAGYVSRGIYGDTFLAEVDTVVNARTQIVLLFGSDNDVAQPGLDPSVARTLRRVRALAPLAQLIVIGPPAPPAQHAQQLQGIRDLLKTAAHKAGGRFVDPLALRWFQDNAVADVGPDDEHPNELGEQYLAEQIASVLEPAIRC